MDINNFQRNLVFTKEAILDTVVLPPQDTSITISLFSLSPDGASVCKYFSLVSNRQNGGGL